VKNPEEALIEARARSAAAAPGEEGLEEPEVLEDPRHVSLQRLTDWAVIEPKETEVYSTRRWGAPITLIKKLLVRLMRQYMFSVSGQQTRFNLYALGELSALQKRVRELEDAAGAAPAAANPGAPSPAPSDSPPDSERAGQ
jgi:hypothetical protein